MVKKKTSNRKKASTGKKKTSQRKKEEQAKKTEELKTVPQVKDQRTTTSSKKIKSMQKRYLIIIPIIVIICIIALLWFTQTSESVTAQLIIDSGTVQVKHEGGSWTAAENGILLSSSDAIKTGPNTSASVIFFESSIIRLDSNTEITIQQIIQQDEEISIRIQQDAGRTWNTISKISGIDDYEVQTPTTVASVRGTAFVVIVEPNGTTYYGVSHGILNVSSVSNGVIQGSIDVSGNESVIVYVDMIGKTLEIKPFDIDDWVLENLLEDEQLLLDIKAELYSRLEPYIPELKEEYGVTDEELEVLLDGYIQGYFDLPPETPQWIRDIIELS